MQLIIQLPPRAEQMVFNQQRWEEVLSNQEIARLPGKIETNAHGNILIMAPASGKHSDYQEQIQVALRSLLGGRALPECPISTIDGVRAADVAWYSDERFAQVKNQILFETAGEICVEILSPSNTPYEMAEKRRLYFEAGAEEAWICDEQGTLHFYESAHPDKVIPQSKRCPEFPKRLQH